MPGTARSACFFFCGIAAALGPRPRLALRSLPRSSFSPTSSACDRWVPRVSPFRGVRAPVTFGSRRGSLTTRTPRDG
eukprot:7440006-Alexandrium_andersonii.AAC.1